MKKYILILFSFCVLLVFLFSSYTKTHQQKINLYFPNEMHFVIPKLIEVYNKDHNNITIQFEEVASTEFDALPKKGIHIYDSWSQLGNKTFLYSPLVVIGHRKIYNLEQLKNSSISIPDPDYSIVGVNVIKMLRFKKLWDPLKRSISYKKKGILSMESVDLGEDDYAILAEADALFVKNAFLVLSLEDESEFSVQYGIKNYDQKQEAQTEFYEFLHSEEASKIFEKYGFLSATPANSSKSEG